MKSKEISSFSSSIFENNSVIIKIIDRETYIPNSIYMHNLHNKELEQAEKIPLGNLRREYLASRLLVKELTKNKNPYLKNFHKDNPFITSNKLSISHKKGHAVAVYSKDQSTKGVGIDLESVNKFNLRLERKICSPSETLLLNKLCEEKTTHHRNLWLCYIFSIKETIYKSLFPNQFEYKSFFDFNVETMDHKHALVKIKNKRLFRVNLRLIYLGKRKSMSFAIASGHEQKTYRIDNFFA